MNQTRDIWYLMLSQKRAKQHIEPEHMQSTDPLFILYTSGTTGNRKESAWHGRISRLGILDTQMGVQPN
jgi:acyl-coenzyme A synthetase/AMP-(fatty) acid ligase